MPVTPAAARACKTPPRAPPRAPCTPTPPPPRSPNTSNSPPPLPAGDRRPPPARTLAQVRRDRRGVHVQVVGVVVGERRAHVAPVVLQRGFELLLGGDQDLRLRCEQLEQRPEPIDGQKLGDVRA